MAEKLYLETDDRLKVGDKPLKHTNPKSQEVSDEHLKNRKQLVKQFTKEKEQKQP